MAWHDIFSTNNDLANSIARYELVECTGPNEIKTVEEQDAFIRDSSDAIVGNLSRSQMINLLDRYRRQS